jgi:hypothetical protein
MFIHTHIYIYMYIHTHIYMYIYMYIITLGKDLYSASCVNKLWSYTAMDPAIWE